jgi:hypothetical protein
LYNKNMETPPFTTPQLPNYFISSLAQTLNVGGNDTSIQLGTIYTLDGQVVDTADFATFGRGIVTIDPLALNSVEFSSFTGLTPGTAPAGTLTGTLRGLSFKNNTQIIANQKFHVVGAPVLIAFGTHNIIDIINLINTTYTVLYNLIQSVVITGALPASTILPGIAMVAEDSDIETGNDQRIFDAIEYPLFVLPSQVRSSALRSFLALNDIAPNDAVYSTSANLTASPVFDSSTLSSSLAFTATVGNNPNRLLLVTVVVQGATGTINCAGVTYNGVSMTNIATATLGNNGFGQSIISYLFLLIAPTVGANGVAITATGLYHASAYSWYNTDQASGVDVTNTATGAGGGATPIDITTIDNDSIVFGVSSTFGLLDPIHAPSVTFNAVTSLDIQESPIQFVAGDSAIISVAGIVTTNFVWNNGGGSSNSGTASIVASIKPLNAVLSYGVDVASSADHAHSDTFIGFSPTGGLSGTLVPVISLGYVDGIGVIDDVYYLQDAPGTIGTTPGTVTKKVGIGTNPGTLLVIVE